MSPRSDDDFGKDSQGFARNRDARRHWRLIVIGIGGLALGPILITLGERLGWSPRLAPYFFFGGWAILLACVALEYREARAVRSR